MTHPDEPGSLASIPISRHRMEVGGKQGDLTLELMLAKDAVVTADIHPQLAGATDRLIGYLEEDAPEDSFFARCRKRIRDFINRRPPGDTAPPAATPGT